MTLQFIVYLVQLQTVRTLIRSSAAVHAACMLPQVAGIAEALVTYGTRVRFIARVHSHVTVQRRERTERFAAFTAIVQLLTAVSSAVTNQLRARGKLPATDTALKRSVSGMTSPVSGQVLATLKTRAAFRAPVLTGMNIHVLIKGATRRIAFIANSTQVQRFNRVTSYVKIQASFCQKPFVTHDTQI